MAPRTLYANLTDGLQPFSLWDQSLADMGLLGTIPCTAAGTNAIVLTPLTSAFAPTVIAYSNYLRFSFVPAGASTGSVTAAIGTLAALNVYKYNGTSVVQAGSGDIVAGVLYVLVYSSALNSNVGGFYLSQVTAGTGATVTLTGDVTGTGTDTIATTVAKINGVTLGTTTATSGNILIGSGTQWVTNAITGAISLTSGGVTALTTSAFANPSANIGLSAINGSATTAMRSDGAPALSQSIIPTWAGTHTFNANPAIVFGQTGTINLSNQSQNQLFIQGAGNSRTTSIALNPGGGTLPIDTITELSIGSTAGQAFGGNYGRWSFTNNGSSLSYSSGLYGEFGGTTATGGTMGPFIIQNGVENPPGTFTVTEWVRFQTTNGGSEDAQLGASLFGANQPTPATSQNRIVLIKPSIGSPGARDSDTILWEGKANNGTERAVWWRQYSNVTSNAGLSTFLWQQNLNGGGWTTKMSLNDVGQLSIGAAASLQANMVLAVKGAGTGIFTFGQLPGNTQYAGMWFVSATPSSTNYGFIQDSTGVDPVLYFNSGPSGTPGPIAFQTGTTTRVTISAAGGFSIGTGTDPGVGNLFVNNDAGIGTNALTSAFLAVAAGTTAKSQINLASSTAPTSPNNGDIWFDGTNVKIRVAGVTKTFTIT